MPTQHTSARLPITLLCVLALSACGTAPSNPDAGDLTADAGDLTADAGDPTADAGDTTPDAGDTTPDAGSAVPVFHARMFNMAPTTAGGGALATPPVLYFSEVPSFHLTPYVDVPVGTATLQFGPSALAIVDTSAVAEGAHVLIGVISYSGTIVARMLVEADNADTGSRRIDFASAGRTIVVEGTSGNASIAVGETGSIVVPNTQGALMFGTSAGATDHHFTTARIPAGGRATIVSYDQYYLMGAPGLQQPLPGDVQLAALNFSFGLGEDAVFKATTPVGEVTLAENVDRATAVSATAWVPRPVTQLSAGQGTQGGSATLAVTEEMQDSLVSSQGGPVVIVGFGNTATLRLHGELQDPANGGNFLAITGLDSNIRFKATVLNQNGSVVGWYPESSPGVVEPLGTLALFLDEAQPSFRVGFGIANPPNLPQGSPEPTFSLTGVVGSHSSFFYTSSGAWKLSLIRANGTVTEFSANL